MNRDQLAALVETLPDPLVVVRGGAEGAHRIVLTNAAAHEVLRFNGNPMLAAVVRRPEVLDIVEAALASGAAGEAIYDPGAAQERTLRAFARPLPADEDGAAMAMLVIRDETDARRNERMRADFLANASHELRTPLASLAGFIETLRGHAKDDPEARERFLGIMAAQAERMSRLIADLMSLSRIELNEHIPPSGEVDLVACARDVADSLGPIAAEREVRIAVEGGPASITGDRDQIVQVLQNLVENAVKYSPAGGTVQVAVTPDQVIPAVPPNGRSLLEPDTDAAARFVAVRVTDKGPGMTRDLLPRLTERFYRAPGQKSGETSGTGLGLAIVKHIVNRHRGGLLVESAPGEGSSFTAWFPQG